MILRKKQWLNKLLIFQDYKEKFFLLFNYDESNSFLFVNATKIYQFRAKDSEIKPYSLCLGSISKDFTANSIKKQD